MDSAETRVAPRNFAIRQAADRKAGKLIPRDVLVEVTHSCNLRCLHCGIEPYINKTQPSELTFSEITSILDKLFEAGILSITISGGEPLCRPDIFEIMNHVREKGLFFGLKTNGTMINENNADKLKELGTSGIHVSLYGAKPETHDYVTGVTDSFQKTVHAIEMLKLRKIRVTIRTVMMKYNYKEDKDIQALADRLGVTYKPDPMIFPKVGQPGSADGIRITDEQLREFIEQHNWTADFDGTKPDNLNRHLLCTAGRTRCTISPEGELFPCALWRVPLGDLKQQSFLDIWNSEAVQSIRAITVNDYPTCVKCELVHYCSRCPGLVYMENSGVSGPSSENCRLARAIKGVQDDKRQETIH